MKNTSNNGECYKTDSPKTAGGISKSLLTPCRRVGLSRKWKKSPASPFISPLTHTSSETIFIKKKQEKQEDYKNDEGNDTTVGNNDILKQNNNQSDLNTTNKRNLESIVDTTPHKDVNRHPKKKFKRFMNTLNSSNNKIESEVEDVVSSIDAIASCPNIGSDGHCESFDKSENNLCVVAKSVKSLNIEKNVFDSPNYAAYNEADILSHSIVSSEQSLQNISKCPIDSTKNAIKIIEPNNLAKECINIISNKLYKTTNKKKIKLDTANILIPLNIAIKCQGDSDDEPLSLISKSQNKTSLKIKINKTISKLDINDEDFMENTCNQNSSIKKNQSKKIINEESINVETKSKQLENRKDNAMQVSKICTIDDDDDFNLTSRKTILIKKHYIKPNKLNKCKSTGSITQKDIDDLKDRIQLKKELLYAKTKTKDTEELRHLIKKWRKGCQDALTELILLMKQKFPDKHNMDFSELLQMLKIPSDIVGYDIDHDCFKSPNDIDLFALYN